MATIIRDMPLELDLSKMTTADIFTPEAYELIKRLEFKSMFSRFEQKTTQTETVETAFTHITTAEEAKNFFDNLEQKETAYILLVDDGAWKGMSVCQNAGEGVFLEITEELPPQTLADCAKDFFTAKDKMCIRDRGSGGLICIIL